MTVTMAELRPLDDDQLQAIYLASPDDDGRQVLAEARRRDRLDAERRARAAERAEWEDAARAQYLAAEAATKGNLVNRRGAAAGVSDWSLWSGPTARAYAYATEELRNFWTFTSPRVTVTGFRQQISAGHRIQRDEAEAAAMDSTTQPQEERDTTMPTATAEQATRYEERREELRQECAERAASMTASLQAGRELAHREDGTAAAYGLYGGDQLLRDTRKVLRHFGVWPSEHALNLCTLWIAAAHAVDPDEGVPVWEYASRLFITAPGYGYGKSWLAKLVASLCPAGRALLEPTKPALIDMIADHNTIVVTEVDELLRSPGRNRGIVAVINGSYEPGHFHARKRGGKTHEVHLFAPMILDGLDTLLKATRPDMRAAASRSHIIRVAQAPDGYRHPRWDKDARAIAARGRGRLAAWMAREVADGMAEDVVVLPDGLSPRRCSLYEPLFIVAQRADRGDPDGYWSTAMHEAAEHFEAELGLPDAPEDTTGALDEIMATWDEED